MLAPGGRALYHAQAMYIRPGYPQHSSWSGLKRRAASSATPLLLVFALLGLLAAPPLRADSAGDGKSGKGGSVSVAPDPEAPGLSTSQRLEKLIERIKWEQARLKSMEASFVQNKVSMLLIKPEEARGKFWYQAPDKVRWDYEKPNPTTVLVNEEHMLTWYHDLKRAERIDVGKQADRVMQYLSASNSLESLQRYFILKVSFPKDPKEPYRLELSPRFARVAKRIQSMAVHLDRAGYWPVFVKFVEPDGDSTELRFENVKLNAGIGPEVFTIELPKDVEVKVIDLASKTGGKGDSKSDGKN